MAGSETVSDLREMSLARLSICPCGYGVLLDSIQIGAVYQCDINTLRNGYVYRCGRCGTIQRDVEVIDCAQRTQPGIKPMPYALFLPKTTQ